MNFLSGTLYIGRVAGISVHIHILFLIYIAYRLISSGGDWASELSFLAMLFGVVFVHELGHCAGARMVGGDAHNILLWPLGGIAFAHAPMRPWPQFVTVACGPLVNVLFCASSALAISVGTGRAGGVSLNPFDIFYGELTAEWQIHVVRFYALNLMLLYFNLLPIYPMDGGQLLWTVLWPALGLQRATMVACQLGVLGAAVLVVLGLRWQAPMMVVIAIFGGMAAFQQYQRARFGLIHDDNVGNYDRVQRYNRRRGFWSRLLGGRRRVDAFDAPEANPNPGGWERKLSESEQLEAEVDRILKKVHERGGVEHLTYVERQTLERASRLRRERDIHGGTRS